MNEGCNRNIDIQSTNPSSSLIPRNVIPMTIIPKSDTRPSTTAIRNHQPGPPISPTYRLVPIQHYNVRKTVNFSVLGPIAITLEEEDTNTRGCSVLDLILPAPSQIGEIVFRNFYTAWITLLAYFENGTVIQYTDKLQSAPVNKILGPLPGGAKLLHPPSEGNENSSSVTALNNSEKSDICEWIVTIPCRVLMPNCNYEIGSQDFVSITASECFVLLKDVKALRLVLHQPSPIWQTFYVEELNIYTEPKETNPDNQSHIQRDPLLALLRCQTMGAIFKRTKFKANAPTNMESPVYEFFNLPEE
ncbi:hypothetical protein C0J52_25161 [Blattella germanica]|nr:hypothetical protein C0J52_25161 [Blattella germanica]